jgi:hypothetical protein
LHALQIVQEIDWRRFRSNPDTGAFTFVAVATSSGIYSAKATAARASKVLAGAGTLVCFTFPLQEIDQFSVTA